MPPQSAPTPAPPRPAGAPIGAQPGIPAPSTAAHRVVVVGGGFAGLEATKALAEEPVEVVLIDRRNHHLFQPLLYQVATGGLSPGDIASPLRAIVARQGNVRTLQAGVVDIDPEARALRLDDGSCIAYDTLVVATGMRSHYFGNPRWAEHAPGLKSVADALEIRRRVLSAFEAAERAPDPEQRRAWLRFVVIGGGPTGVELAGALAELAHHTLRRDFRHIDPRQAEILLLEGMPRLLPPYPEALSADARKRLEDMGVTVHLNSKVTDIDEQGVRVTNSTPSTEPEQTEASDRARESEQRIAARTVLWAAGLRATGLAEAIAERTGAEQDRSGRLAVAPDLSLPAHPDILVAGDLALFEDEAGHPLPGLAPVALQQGRHVAAVVRARLGGTTAPAFRYRDRGSMAVIGRNAAVADLGRLQLRGRVAWLMWIFVHIAFLIGFDNKLRVLLQWAWMYATRKRGARLITARHAGEPDGEAPA